LAWHLDHHRIPGTDTGSSAAKTSQHGYSSLYHRLGHLPLQVLSVLPSQETGHQQQGPALSQFQLDSLQPVATPGFPGLTSMEG
jgi:hypothetical protein